MQRDTRSFKVEFEDLKAVWALVSSTIMDDPIECSKFWAPKLDEAITTAYKHVYRLYDELSNLEQENIIEGVDAISSNSGVLSFEEAFNRSLKKVDWEAVLYSTIERLDQLKDLLPKSCLNKLKRRKKLLDLFRPKVGVKDSSSIRMFLSEQGLSEHWLTRCYEHSWYGSIYDLAFSPLLSFVSVDTDIAYNLKKISDTLDSFDVVSMSGRDTSILLVKRVSRILEDIVEWIDVEEPEINVVLELMKNKGYYQNDVFLVCRALHRVYTSGKMTGTVIKDDVSNLLAFINEHMSARNIKYLYEYPLSVFV